VREAVGDRVMMRLNRETLSRIGAEAAGVTAGPLDALPERVLQFGEGNFLRCFVDWMIDGLNRQGLFRGQVVVIQPIERGMVETLNEQDGLYTCILRGIEGGQVIERREIITAIRRGIDPYRDWNACLAAAAQPEIRFVVSNTTEAGIAFLEESRPAERCPASFPAKVAALLYERFQRLGGGPKSGLVFLPCELIDRNGEQLRRHVLRHAAAWGLPQEFVQWVSIHNHFLTTLVDRIVPGYPDDEMPRLTAELGYEDRLLTAGEIFHIWVIEGDAKFAVELPLAQAGLNVVWTNDLRPYRMRKVRILNGAHTMSALAAYLMGLETVRESLEDPLFGAYVRRGVFDEILPALPVRSDEDRAIAESVMERLKNPFIRHHVMSIALNSVSKYRVRVLPSLLDYRAAYHRLPPALTFSLAALLAFYRGTEIRDGALWGSRAGSPYAVRDDAPVLAAFAEQWRAYQEHGDLGACVRALLARADFWGEDLCTMPDLVEGVTMHLSRTLTRGIREALGGIA
jgi:tagaturonate reductase